MELEQLITTLTYCQDIPLRPLCQLPTYKILYVVRGSMQLDIGAHRLRIGPQTLLCMNNLEEQTLSLQERPCVRHLACFSPGAFELLIGSPRLISIFKNPFSERNVFRVEPIAQQLGELFHELEEEQGRQDEYAGLLSAGLVQRLMVTLARAYPASFPAVTEGLQTTIFSVQQYLDRHLQEPLRIGDIAGRFFLSPSYLTHGFKKYTGYTPMQYLKLSRLSYSKSLLLETNCSISEIAARSGFSDPNNYIKAFKKHFHTTPRQLRQELLPK